MPGAIARIEISSDICIGSDACVAVAPKTFKIDPETDPELPTTMPEEVAR
jgi:ferredoxin